MNLFTISYEGRTADDLPASMAASGVTTVIDVRDLPLSRKRGFSKTALASLLAQSGVDYVHERGLGNPKPLRDHVKSHRVEPSPTGPAGHCRPARAIIALGYPHRARLDDPRANRAEQPGASSLPEARRVARTSPRCAVESAKRVMATLWATNGVNRCQSV
jgi:hypothetical protein